MKVAGLAAGLGMLAMSMGLAAQTGSCLSLGAVPFERLSCGCSIRIEQDRLCTSTGAGGQPHLFTELQPDAPLLAILNGKETLLQHLAHRGESVKGDAKGRWVDVYRVEDIEVSLKYRPAPSTCPRDKPDGCEFVDVAVDVQWKQAGRVSTLKGSGQCGC